MFLIASTTALQIALHAGGEGDRLPPGPPLSVLAKSSLSLLRAPGAGRAKVEAMLKKKNKRKEVGEQCRGRLLPE